MAESTTFSLRISNELLNRIEQSATQAGTNRTAYIISWLPDHYDSTAENTQNQQQSHNR